MSEQRLIDARAIELCEVPYDMGGYADLDDVEDYIDSLPTIDPETLPIVQELRAKLARYEKAEQEGWLIELPCKDWLDIVFGEQSVFYYIDTDYIDKPIREINVDNEQRISWYDGYKNVFLIGFDENGNYIEFRPEEIGKTVFLTKEEAESALKEREK